MSISRNLSLIAAAVSTTAIGLAANSAPITAATFTPDPTSSANQSQFGTPNVAFEFASITVGGVEYNQFSYGTASVVAPGSEADDYYYPDANSDPGSINSTLTGGVVTDGVFNVNALTQVIFDRAITATDQIFIADLVVNNATGGDSIWVALTDAGGSVITDEVNLAIGTGGTKLLDFAAKPADTDTAVGYDLYGSAYTLADFGWDITDGLAYGVEVTQTGDADPSVFGLAAIPEPASLALLSAGALMMLSRRARIAR